MILKMKGDKMEAVKYFEEKKRMLNSVGRTIGFCDSAECSDCPLYFENNGRGLDCNAFEILYPEEAVAIVEKWSQEHPRKTMLQDFLEKYPKARLEKNGTPKDVCPKNLGYCEGIYCEINKLDCVACWSRPLEEGDK